MDDTLYEGAETAVLAVLAGTGYVLGSQTSASGTIADNDAAPVLPVVGVVATDEIGAETGAGVARDTITFTLTCTGDVSRTLVEGFGWFGTAKLGKAFTASVSAGGVLSKTTVTLAAGVSSVTITITPIDDTTVEAVENVVFTLKAGTAYTLGTSSATGTIADNDGKAAKMASTSTSSSRHLPDQYRHLPDQHRHLADQYRHCAWQVPVLRNRRLSSAPFPSRLHRDIIGETLACMRVKPSPVM